MTAASTTAMPPKLLQLAVVSAVLIANCMGDAGERFPPQRYCAIHANHTLCKHQGRVSPTCGRVVTRGLSDEERVEVVRLHNQKRAFLANGMERRGDPGPQPMAANMMEMTYDEELEVEAQAWTDQCVRGHDCPDCRTLSRFKVGQNLFWFGHFTGSWERSVQGWYDEVADFNSSFVYPFYVIPGVLVGHFTQLAWAQTYKVGCGKLFSYPTDDPDLSRFGQQFYVCNYGLAGNLIRSEMYKVGAPCSACPAGTSCSQDHPGLCAGTPAAPLTIRPPKFGHNFGLRPRPPGNGGGNSVEAPPAVQTVTLPTVFVSPPTSPVGKETCSYRCDADGGCSVRFASPSPFSGSVLGSCFPPSFGGDCSGTPERCRECIGVCRGHAGMTIDVELQPDGSEGPRETSPLMPDSSNSVDGGGQSSGSSTCTYSCQDSGGCSVRINSATLVNGSVLGSCFSELFGGSCSGTPRGCSDCLAVCRSHKPNGGEIELPAKS